ncbi:MAG: hypothetical protein A4E40_00544 [Methanoregulaceae archaeon PtaU1.Bin059]|nr:MAG: hypothetical protein A4E40_00544 [Methanoregulaceae archaeon PtaU1.Bin059]
MSAYSNPSATARPKCSSPAGVSRRITSSGKYPVLARMVEMSVYSGQRHPVPAFCTPPITRRRTPSAAGIANRSATSATSGLRTMNPPRPGTPPIFSWMYAFCSVSGVIGCEAGIPSVAARFAWGSPSTARTGIPRRENACASRAVSVVLPTPPFPATTTRIFLLFMVEEGRDVQIPSSIRFRSM